VFGSKPWNRARCGLALCAAACLALTLSATSAGASSSTGHPVATGDVPVRAATAEPRVVGGGTTTISNYPWQAALVLDARFGGNAFQRHMCGGSVISPFIVLTAAHCVIDTDPDCLPPPIPCDILDEPPGDGTHRLDSNDVDIVLGRTTLSSTGGVEHNAFAVYFLSSYNPSNNRNDVGWISIDPATGQTPIDVAGAGERSLWAVGAQTEVSGWGHTSQGGSGSDTLKSAVVPIIADSTCASDYGSAFFADVMVCAGFQTGGTDSCQGDSGGPLQAPMGAGGYRLVGIVSFGFGCAQPNAPGIYSRIADATLCPAVVNATAEIENIEGITPNASIVNGGCLQPTPPPPPPSGATPVFTAPAATENPACATLRAKLKKAKTKRAKRKIRRKLRALGC
jgi:trypsin